MTKREAESVQQVIFQPEFLYQRVNLFGIDRIAENRMTDQFTMNAELMCAPSQRLQFQQSMRGEPARNTEAGVRFFSIIHDFPAGPFVRVMTDRSDYFAVVKFDYPAYRREIEFFHPPQAKMFCESAMRAWCLGYNDDTGSVTIESMNQTRTERRATGLPEVIGQPIGQCPGLFPA